MIDVEIPKEPVELYKVLKFENLVASGGEAKLVISEGLVLLNGEIETRKRKKIVSGDVVQLSWFGDESQYYNFLTAKYNKNGVGDIPFTATTNFYNTNDVNYDKLKTNIICS